MNDSKFCRHYKNAKTHKQQIDELTFQRQFEKH